MTVISDAELTKMRAAADDYFPDTCTIQTQTESVDALGGVVHTWANTYTGVACRLDPERTRQGEQVSSLVLESQSRWMLNIPHDQAISVEDRVIHDGKTYEVATVVDTQSYRTIRRAELRRVD
jgi:SPP1 family predicted phage head-tail adaptor